MDYTAYCDFCHTHDIVPISETGDWQSHYREVKAWATTLGVRY